MNNVRNKGEHCQLICKLFIQDHVLFVMHHIVVIINDKTYVIRAQNCIVQPNNNAFMLLPAHVQNVANLNLRLDVFKLNAAQHAALLLSTGLRVHSHMTLIHIQMNMIYRY